MMIFGDAVIERIAVGSAASPLLELLSGPTTASRLAAAVEADPHLRGEFQNAESLVLALLELDAAQLLRISPRPCGVSLQQYYDTGQPGLDRSLAYVATYERNWTSERQLYDFVETADANAARKAFQRDIYLRHLDPYLDRLAAGAAVLDAGCGVGRLTQPLLSRGLALTCADASAQALKCAVRVALHCGASSNSFEARLCDVRDLACFEDRSFDASIALELICYQEDPAVSLRELIRVTASGGLVAISVEGLHGSLIADPKLAAGLQRSVLDTGALDIDDQISVRYFTKESLRRLLEGAALEGVEVVGTHYTADGVLDRLVSDAALGDPEQLRDLIALERAAAADPVLEPLARAWLATGRVPAAASR